jgi:hypothetical protein
MITECPNIDTIFNRVENLLTRIDIRIERHQNDEKIAYIYFEIEEAKP